MKKRINESKQAFIVLDPALMDKVGNLDGVEYEEGDDTVWSYNPVVTKKLMAFAKTNPTRLKISSFQSTPAGQKAHPGFDAPVNLESKNMNKFEKLIEYIINEDEAKAKALFHQIVVEKSRDIYESLQEDEFDVEAGDGADSLGDEIGDDQDEIAGDEEGIESDDEFGGDDLGGDVEEVGGDEGGLEDRVMDLEDALDELKAEFDDLMGDEAAEEENFPGIHDEEGSDDLGGDLDGEESDFGGDDIEGGDDVGAELDSDDEFGESASVYEGRKSPAELMREYVEKVGQDWGKNNPSEGDPIGSGGSKSPINSKSNVISGKNDMGGTTKNIAAGGTASDKDSNTGPKKPSNAYTKGETKVPGADNFENVPAANTKGYKDKKSVNREKEGQTTKEAVPVNTKSFNPGGKPGYKG